MTWGQRTGGSSQPIYILFRVAGHSDLGAVLEDVLDRVYPTGIYIYIYSQRERKRVRNYVYIYIHVVQICMCMFMFLSMHISIEFFDLFSVI